MKHKPMEVPMEQSEEMMDHETNEHIDTLHKAHKIMKDKSKMQRVHKVIKNKHHAIKEMSLPGDEDEVTSIKDIKNKANKKAEKMWE